MFSQHTFLAIAAIITLSGVWMQWRVHSFCMSAEEAMKDGKLTQDQVTRRLTFFKQGSRILTVAGMALLVVAALMMPE